MNFTELGLNAALLCALKEKEYDIPSPIQAQAIPVILQGRDLLASAQTGTGKTAAYTLPILQNLTKKSRAHPNHARVLILTPTRELAAQVHANVVQYGSHLTSRSAVVFGGVKINPQLMSLRGGVEILVATPGRLLDLHQQNAIGFEQIEILVLDEADRMLDMGFINDIKRILAKLPRKRQNLLFSATFSNTIRHLAKELLVNPVEIDVAPRNTAAIKVTQLIHPVDKSRKVALLSHLIREKNWHQALVFSRTKHGANKLVKSLTQDKIDALAIHGNKSQSQRMKALADFKAGKIQILVATDIAARGIDIDQLPLVVNFDLPHVAEDYVHRIGRTGRASFEGCAISLVCADEAKQLQDIERLLKQRIERLEIDDFEPSHVVPVSNLNDTKASKHYADNRAKKPNRGNQTYQTARLSRSKPPVRTSPKASGR
jgi:ATP-dependent RNA helicase RhlE